MEKHGGGASSRDRRTRRRRHGHGRSRVQESGLLRNDQPLLQGPHATLPERVPLRAGRLSSLINAGLLRGINVEPCPEVNHRRKPARRADPGAQEDGESAASNLHGTALCVLARFIMQNSSGRAENRSHAERSGERRHSQRFACRCHSENQSAERTLGSGSGGRVRSYMQTIRIGLVSERGAQVGATTLCMRFIDPNRPMSRDYIPTGDSTERRRATLMAEKSSVSIDLLDSAARLPVDVTLLCFSMADRCSFEYASGVHRCSSE